MVFASLFRWRAGNPALIAEIHHGDCVDILPKLNVTADLILTSPPYDNLRQYGDTIFDFPSVAQVCVDALADNAVLVWVVSDATINGSETGTSFRQALHFMEMGLLLHDTMIARFKRTPLPTRHRYAQMFEYMFVFSKGPPKTGNMLHDVESESAGRLDKKTAPTRAWNGDVKHDRAGLFVRKSYCLRSNVWEYGVGGKSERFQKARKHPAIFPTKLAQDHIRTWTNPGDLVIDPMCGSGTTVRAARDLRRNAIGIEIHEPYVDIARKRLAQQVLV